jgi:hypothetical protein
MLIHYFGSREILEQKAFALLEDRLRDRFSASRFPPGVSIATVVTALWDQSTAPQSRGTLLLIMDVNRRGWSGSDRARAFYFSSFKGRSLSTSLRGTGNQDGVLC